MNEEEAKIARALCPMNEEELEIARAFVACSRWKRLPGMLAWPIGGGFPLRYNKAQCRRSSPRISGVRYIPDITDPRDPGVHLSGGAGCSWRPMADSSASLPRSWLLWLASPDTD